MNSLEINKFPFQTSSDDFKLPIEFMKAFSTLLLPILLSLKQSFNSADEIESVEASITFKNTAWSFFSFSSCSVCILEWQLWHLFAKLNSRYKFIMDSRSSNYGINTLPYLLSKLSHRLSEWLWHSILLINLAFNWYRYNKFNIT